MNMPPLIDTELKLDPVSQDPELAAFLDSMLLLAPLTYSTQVFGDSQESKGDALQNESNENPSDVHEKQEEDSITYFPTQYDELALEFGLIEDSSKLPEYHHDERAALVDLYTKIHGNKESLKSLRVLLYFVAHFGNITESLAKHVPSKLIDMIAPALKDLGIKFRKQGAKRDPLELDLAGLAELFLAEMFKTLKRLTIPSYLQRFLPSEVSERIPRELTFLQVGDFLCLLLKLSDRRKLVQVVVYISNQFCKQMARVTGHDEERIRHSVQIGQFLAAPNTTKLLLKELELLEALSRVKLPTQSTNKSKKRINGKKMVKVKPSKT